MGARIAALHRTGSTILIPETVDRVRRAFETHRSRPLEWRLGQLGQVQRLLKEREDELTAALQADLHKSPFEGWLTELSFVAGEVRYARRNLRRWMKPLKAKTPLMAQPGHSWLQPEPKGVALIIAPWNYPLSMVLAPLVGVISAGCAAVLKPSEVTSHTSAILARLLPQYLDPEMYVVVEGAVEETTALLAQRWDHIFYTGNERVGQIVMSAAAKHLTPVTLELGGKSPVLVDASADIEVTAARIAWGKFLNAGQTCVAPDHVLVQREVAPQLLDALARRIREFYGDDPQQSPDFGRIASERHAARFATLLQGQRLHCGGRVDVADRYVAPTLVIDPAPDSPLMQEEIFGPVLPVIAVDSMETAMRQVAARPKPLALYLFSRNPALEDEVASRLSAGSVCFNDVVIFMAAQELPFGGVGNSGIGRYSGWYGFETFSHMKPVMKRSFRLDSSLRYPPYDARKERIARLVS
jgi:aldehyde dehydrogenase (NAD+)